MSLDTNIHNPIICGAQEELMQGTPDQKKIPIAVTTCISWMPRSIESVKASYFSKVLIPKIQPWGYTVQIAGELLVEIIQLNNGKAREPSKHLQVLEQLSKIFKDKMDLPVPRVPTPTVTTAPTASR